MDYRVWQSSRPWACKTEGTFMAGSGYHDSKGPVLGELRWDCDDRHLFPVDLLP